MASIELSKEEYQRLVKLLFLGEWVSSAFQEEQPVELWSVVQKVFSKAGDFGIPELVEHDSEADEYFVNADFEEDLMAVVDDYDRSVMWEEIVEMLAARDMDEEYGGETIEDMDEGAYMEALNSHTDKYYDEFEKNGVARLKITE